MGIIIAIAVIGIIVFVAYKNNKETQERMAEEETKQAELKHKEAEMTEEIDKLREKVRHLCAVSPKDFDAAKVRELERQIKQLENERYELCGTPTAEMRRLGLDRLKGEPERKQPEKPAKNKADNVPWFALGVATGKLEDKKRELKKTEAELKKALDKINKLK